MDAEDYLENISYQSSMLLNLINDLLDFAKLETLNFELNEESFNLDELIDQAYNTVKYQASQKNIRIMKDYQVRIQDT